MLHKTLTLKNLVKKEPNRDTIEYIYKEVSLRVCLDKDFINGTKNIVVSEVKSSTFLKTKSGISLGDDKFKIIATYDGYTIYLMPEYENNGTVKSKNKSTIWLHGEESGHVNIFYLTDNKVTAISSTYDEGC